MSEFINIYSAEIYTPDKIFIMKEYKTTNGKAFTKGNFPCAWFIFNNEKLDGPLLIDTEAIKTGKRIIKDPEYSQLNGIKMTNINKSNDKLSEEQIQYLKTKIE